MSNYKTGHKMWNRAIAIVAVCLFLINGISWAILPAHKPYRATLAAQSIFKPMLDAVGMEYLSRLKIELGLIIGMALEGIKGENPAYESRININAELDKQSGAELDRDFGKILEVTANPDETDDGSLEIQVRTTGADGRQRDFRVMFKGDSVDDMLDQSMIMVEAVTSPEMIAQDMRERFDRLRKMPVKAVVFDLDRNLTIEGTQRLAPEAIEMILSLRQMGVRVMINTGRRYEPTPGQEKRCLKTVLVDIHRYMQKKGIIGQERKEILGGLYMASEGGLLIFNGFMKEESSWETYGDQLLEKLEIRVDQEREERLKDFLNNIDLEKYGFSIEAREAKERCFSIYPSGGDINALRETVSRTLDEAGLLDGDVLVMNSPNAVDIIFYPVNKGVSLSFFSEILGIEDDEEGIVLTIGDAGQKFGNDNPMLARWGGLSSDKFDADDPNMIALRLISGQPPGLPSVLWAMEQFVYKTPQGLKKLAGTFLPTGDTREEETPLFSAGENTDDIVRAFGKRYGLVLEEPIQANYYVTFFVQGLGEGLKLFNPVRKQELKGFFEDPYKLITERAGDLWASMKAVRLRVDGGLEECNIKPANGVVVERLTPLDAIIEECLADGSPEAVQKAKGLLDKLTDLYGEFTRRGIIVTDQFNTNFLSHFGIDQDGNLKGLDFSHLSDASDVNCRFYLEKANSILFWQLLGWSHMYSEAGEELFSHFFSSPKDNHGLETRIDLSTVPQSREEKDDRAVPMPDWESSILSRVAAVEAAGQEKAPDFSEDDVIDEVLEAFSHRYGLILDERRKGSFYAGAIMQDMDEVLKLFRANGKFKSEEYFFEPYRIIMERVGDLYARIKAVRLKIDGSLEECDILQANAVVAEGLDPVDERIEALLADGSKKSLREAVKLVNEVIDLYEKFISRGVIDTDDFNQNYLSHFGIDKEGNVKGLDFSHLRDMSGLNCTRYLNRANELISGQLLRWAREYGKSGNEFMSHFIDVSKLKWPLSRVDLSIAPRNRSIRRARAVPMPDWESSILSRVAEVEAARQIEASAAKPAERIKPDEVSIMDNVFLLNRASKHLEGYPVDMIIDLSLMPREDIDANMRTWAYLVLLHNQYGLDVNYIFSSENKIFEQEAKRMLLETVLAYSELRTEDIDQIEARINRPHDDPRTIQVRIMKVKDLEKMETLPGNMLPVAMSDDVDGKGIPLRDFPAAAAIGIAQAACKKAQKEDEESAREKPSLPQVIRDVFPRIRDIYRRILPDEIITEETVANMIDKNPVVRKNLAIALALPPIVRIAIDQIEDYHDRIHLLLRAA